MRKDGWARKEFIKTFLMNGWVTVELRQLHFFAYHGLFPEEQKTGNDFEVNLSVSYEPVGGVISGIGDTINYVELYDLVKVEMQRTTPLIETLAMRITTLIHEKFPHVKKTEIS